jgi:hypothetical protein
MSKEQLDKRMIKNSEKLEHVADNVAEKENILEHLNMQREALLDNYIKGQKLALSLWLNNRKRAQHRALVKWFKASG